MSELSEGAGVLVLEKVWDDAFAAGRRAGLEEAAQVVCTVKREPNHSIRAVMAIAIRKLISEGESHE